MDVPVPFQNMPGGAVTSAEVSHGETVAPFSETKEIQGDLEELSYLKGPEYSFPTPMELEENQKDIQFNLWEPQNNDNQM